MSGHFKEEVDAPIGRLIIVSSLSAPAHVWVARRAPVACHLLCRNALPLWRSLPCRFPYEKDF